MNKQEKFLLLVVLVVAVTGSTIYVSNQKDSKNTAVVEQVQTSVPSTNNLPVTTTETTQVTNTGSVPTQNTGNTTSGSNSNTNTNTTNTNTNTTTSTTVTKSKSVTYQVPEGHSETLTVSVTTKDGIISDISFSESPTNSESRQYYQKFSNSFPKSSLIGKSISSVSLSRVGGASLTTGAFNSAIRSL